MAQDQLTAELTKLNFDSHFLFLMNFSFIVISFIFYTILEKQKRGKKGTSLLITPIVYVLNISVVEKQTNKKIVSSPWNRNCVCCLK